MTASGGAGARIHAALVHVPVSAFAGAAALELSAPFRDSATLAGIDAAAATIALLWTGLAVAALAVVAGLIEYARLPERSEVMSTATRHLLLMGSTLLCFLLLALAQPSVAVLGSGTGIRVALSALGAGLLALGAHLGGRLVALRPGS